MSDLLATTLLGIPISSYLIVAAAAAITSIIGGIAGYGSGLLLPLVMVPVIGAEATVPVIGLTAIFTNLGRVAAFRDKIVWSQAWKIVIPALPGVVVGAWYNVWLSGRGVMILLGFTLLAMLSLRKCLERNGLAIPEKAMPVVGFLFGILMGGTTGSGVILIGLLSGLGLTGAALIATDAIISVLVGGLKSLTFGTLGALTPSLALFAVIIGLVTVPSGFVARALLRLMPMTVHTAILDGVIVIGGLGLLWRGLFAT